MYREETSLLFQIIPRNILSQYFYITWLACACPPLSQLITHVLHKTKKVNDALQGFLLTTATSKNPNQAPHGIEHLEIRACSEASGSRAAHSTGPTLQLVPNSCSWVSLLWLFWEIKDVLCYCSLTGSFSHGYSHLQIVVKIRAIWCGKLDKVVPGEGSG